MFERCLDDSVPRLTEANSSLPTSCPTRRIRPAILPRVGGIDVRLIKSTHFHRRGRWPRGHWGKPTSSWFAVGGGGGGGAGAGGPRGTARAPLRGAPVS